MSHTGPASTLKVFISYRRDDAGGYAKLLADELGKVWGDENVFLDVDGQSLTPGVDFDEKVIASIKRCDVVLALIGRRWADATNLARLSDARDLVRREIATARDHQIFLVPVLVGGAAMPARVLPEELQWLERIHAHEISDTRWDYDLARLVDTLGAATYGKTSPPAPPGPGRDTAVGNVTVSEVTVLGDVVHVHNPKGAQDILAMLDMPTEVRPRESAEAAPDSSLQRRLDEVLARVNELQARGVESPEVRAGGVHLSHVDLLLKKAVLLQSEVGRQPDGGVPQNDEEEAAGVGDTRAFYDKLEQAHALLTEARALEPYNAEVLLHLAKVSGLLERYEDERHLLQDAHRLLEAPRDDREQFLRAQAMFMLETIADEPDRARLMDARAVFERLGRTEWLRDIDALLAEQEAAAAGRWRVPDAGVGTDPWAAGTASAWNEETLGALLGVLGLSGVQQPSQPRPGVHGGLGGFDAPAPDARQASAFPLGRWNMEIERIGTIALEMRPDGSFSAVQGGPGGMRFEGGWNWSPPYLVLRGVVQGVPVFDLHITVVEPAGGAIHGVSVDGERLRFVPA